MISAAKMHRLVIMEACPSSELDGGGIATPSLSSAIGYAFVPSLHLMPEMEDPRSVTSLSIQSNPIIRSSPAIMGYSFVPPFHLIQEVDSKPNTSGNSEKSSAKKASSSLLMEKTFYKNISNTLPIKIRQISYNSDEMETPRQITMSQMHRKNPRVQKEFETWNKDIAKQVDHWMKDKPVQSGFLGSLSTQRAPLVSKSQSVKRKKLQKKRFRMKDNDDAMTSRDSESEFSLDSETFRSRRSRGRPPVSKSLSSSKDNANDTTSVFGSIHNEIEFKKRYRRMFDLNKHLQFVNSANGLMGKQILRKTHRLPPMTKELAKSPQKLECSELFAITTVQQSNDPSDFKTPSTQNVYHSLESTDLTDSGYDQTQLSSREVNTSSRKDLLDDDRHSNMSWRPNKTSKPEVFKFGKLPKISNNTIETNSSRDRLSTKDSVEMKSITTRLNDSLQKCASWVSETDSVNDEFSEVREMKVTINIKYKAEDRDKRKSKKSLVVMDDTSLNLTPFDKAKNMSKVNEQENFPGMLSE